jgi:PilZ domain
MGTEMGRIEQEFILNNIIEKKLPVILHIGKKEIEGIFLSMEEDSLLFSSSDSAIGEIAIGDNINFFFAFFSHTMTFNGKIIKDGNPLIVSLPKHIYKNLKRKFVRVPTGNDIELSFTLENARIVLDFPKTQEYESLESEVFSDDFSISSLTDLFKQFKSRASSYADGSEIVMLRGKALENFEEQIIADTGKSFFIPDTSLAFPDKIKINKEFAITEDFFLDKHGNEKVVYGKNLRQLELYLKKKNENGIYAELFAPVIYHEYVVSYIRLFNNKTKDQPFTDKTLDFVREFSRILAYALEKEGYFTGGELRENQYLPEIIDLSASGLLFTHPEKKLSEMLGMYGDLKLILKIGPRKLEMFSRVMRKYKIKGIYFYGIQFLEIVPEDFRFLFDYVYGRPFSDDDDRLWEGGAEPPELKF